MYLLLIVNLPCLWCRRCHFSISITNQKKGGSPTPKEQENLMKRYLVINRGISIYQKDDYTTCSNGKKGIKEKKY